MSFSFVCSPVTDWGHVQDVPHLLPEDSYNMDGWMMTSDNLSTKTKKTNNT